MTIDILLVVLLLVTGVLLWRMRAKNPAVALPSPPAARLGLRDRYSKLARQAGFPPNATWPVYLGIKIALVVLVPLVLADAVSLGWWVLAGAVPGFFLPDAILAYARRKRQDTIRRALSFFLDLIVSLLRAGLTLEEAFKRAARAGLPKGHPLAAEAAQIVAELDLGRERSRGFQALADRTGVMELRGLVNALQLGAGLGASLEATLTIQADLARVRRRQEGLKRATVVSAEVLVPLLLCSFPVFVVLIVLPLGIRLIQSLGVFRTLLQ